MSVGIKTAQMPSPGTPNGRAIILDKLAEYESVENLDALTKQERVYVTSMHGLIEKWRKGKIDADELNAWRRLLIQNFLCRNLRNKEVEE